MTSENVRVRFAPSPTGPLHMGGVRTALYNYLFARSKGGKFLLRIEDTDQTRYVEGAEEYVREALEWCGIEIDEGVVAGGEFGPYRQSERNSFYREAVEKLIETGHAYMAFDTPEELDAMRKEAEGRKEVFQYDSKTRGGCRNSLALSVEEVEGLIEAETPYIIRFMTPDKAEDIVFTDEIRGEVCISSGVIDDKVLVKADGLPTYHLANVVDDHAMEISHVIRGEEWLPSAPLHVMLYRAFGWDSPKFAHLPLILKPTGNGKLSKRDGDAGGFPVFPIEWEDPDSGKVSKGYLEAGYNPQAFLNMLLMLGWNPGDEREIFSLEEAANAFSLDRVVKSGARFSPDKAKWFNEQYLRSKTPASLSSELVNLASERGMNFDSGEAEAILTMMLERVSFLHEIFDAKWLFNAPKSDDFNAKMVRKKWKAETPLYMADLKEMLKSITPFIAEEIESQFKAHLEEKELGFGQVLLPLRLALTGEGGGPSMFEFAEFLGLEKTISRLESGVLEIEKLKAE
ncbi:MAG TPA: glutamate--tRNA ligase [Flavobacteriales bacterium]|nr:glutamate--tRNA ligase [Flavobacteriales bacterium]